MNPRRTHTRGFTLIEMLAAPAVAPEGRRRMRSAFTLIEMLVVIAIIGLLASILVPVVANALQKASTVKVMTNGKAISTSIFAAAADGATFGSVGVATLYAEPNAASYANSTEYFAWLMRDVDDNNGAGLILPEDFALFAAPGLPSAASLTSFGPETNPWSVVTGLNSLEGHHLPFLVSRNLNEATLVDWSQDETLRPDKVGAGNNDAAGSYRDPFGEEAVIVIRLGGSGEVIQRRQMRWAAINTGARNRDGQRPTNPILQPH